jgi:hypothetical protein
MSIPVRRPVLLAVAAAVLATALTLLAGCGDSSPATTTVGAGVDAPAACPPADAAGDAVVDWVDFVRVRGRVYLRTGDTTGSTVPAAATGGVQAHVLCRIAGVVGNPDYVAQDGDASYLPAGTELRRFGTADPRLRLAARVDGAWRVYEVQDVETARTGADLLDLGGGVTSIDLLDSETGTQVMATLDDPLVVQRVVAAVLAAKVQASPSDVLDVPELVAFHLTDGTTVRRPWFRAPGVLATSVQAPPELAEAFPPAR